MPTASTSTRLRMSRVAAHRHLGRNPAAEASADDVHGASSVAAGRGRRRRGRRWHRSFPGGSSVRSLDATGTLRATAAPVTRRTGSRPSSGSPGRAETARSGRIRDRESTPPSRRYPPWCAPQRTRVEQLLQRALGPDARHLALVGGRAAQVVERVDFVADEGGGVADRRRGPGVGRAARPRRCGRARHRGRGAEGDPDSSQRVVRHLSVAAPRRRPWRSRPGCAAGTSCTSRAYRRERWQTRSTPALRLAAVRSRSSRRRTRRAESRRSPARLAITAWPSKRDEHRRRVLGRIGVRQVAADSRLVADADRRHVRERLGQRRTVGLARQATARPGGGS